MLRHIVPNVLEVVVVYASLVPSMILFESFLSFLGLGTEEPLSSWGALLGDGANSMEVSPWLLLFPGGFPGGDPVLFQLYRRWSACVPSTRKTAKERCHDHD
ncbi:hypothetical protein ACPA9J_23750 [Pseudomonas aeruginosa]